MGKADEQRIRKLKNHENESWNTVRKVYSFVEKILRQLAKEGDWCCLMILAKLYEDGIVVVKDKDQSYHYLRRAGDTGALEAMGMLFSKLNIDEMQKEAKNIALKWESMGYDYAMDSYHEEFDE